MSKEEPVFRSLAMIEERLLEKLTVEKLASHLHFSKYHYQRLFREIVGDSVMHYITRRRLSLAAKELAETDTTILEIALKYGYDSHEGFTRSFRAVMGVTPAKYRKYRLSASLPKKQKENCAMMYSKNTDEILRELNCLIVQAKETASYTRKSNGAAPEAAALYSQFWDSIAERADSMADSLREALCLITDIARRPDEISVRFLIMKAIEDAAFQAHITAFQAGLMISRAKPEHREAFQPVCSQYGLLAEAAESKAEKIAAFFHELAALVLADMRKNAEQWIQKAIERGRAAAALMGDPTLPYGYIAEEIAAITDELSSVPLGEVTISQLEDYRSRLDIVAFAAGMDALRAPSHGALLDSVLLFRQSVGEMIDSFSGLSHQLAQGRAEPEAPSSSESIAGKKYRDMALREKVLLFFLKGELQKLGDSRLKEGQKSAFDRICGNLNRAIRLTQAAADEADVQQTAAILNAVHAELTTQAKALGVHGAPMQYLAEEVRRCCSF